MKTEEFLNLLSQHSNKYLVFEYQPNEFVGANYHITEVKHVTIDSVDCGARMDSWKETIIQLWESPSEKNKTEFMSAYKALGILKKVGVMKSFELDAEIKIEYSNSTFQTAQLFINDFETKENQLIVKLAIEKTACKAKELCGVPAEVEMAQLEEPCCSSDGNCC